MQELETRSGEIFERNRVLEHQIKMLTAQIVKMEKVAKQCKCLTE
jgi:hypothetical protein